MASLRKVGKQWYCRHRDETGRQREVKCGPDKSVALSIKRDLESRNAKIKAGVLDPREADCLDADRIPISQHVKDYASHLAAKGCVPEHAICVQKRLTWFLEETKITRLSQLRPSLAITAMAAFRDAGRADRTVSHFATTLKAFSRWAWKDRRTRQDLLADLERPKVVTENKRSPLTSEQAARLVTTTRSGKARRGMTGEDRSWLYTLAIYTGLRRSELQSLTPESFNLDSSPPIVSLPGRDTKNSDDAVQPLPSHVIPALRSWLESKPSLIPLFPHDRNSALMIRADLRAAGIPSDDFDFHGLRHCYVSQIVQTGASVKDAMELARHSDADLTFGRYAHTRLEDLSRVVDKLPDLWEKCGKAISSHTLPTSGVSEGPNGSTPNPQKSRPERSQVDPSRHVFQSGCLDSPGRKSHSGNGEAIHQDKLAHTLPTFSSEDPGLALIVGLWDRLADQIKARLIEIVQENLPTEE